MKKINTSQMCVSTNTGAMDELLEIESVGGRLLEQWYYVTADVWYPDRKSLMTPLVLMPRLQITDPDTGRGYTVDMSAAGTRVTWYYGTLTAGQSSRKYWVWTEITNTVESLNADYTVKPDGSLVVRKNVEYQSPVNLKVAVRYTDPRNLDTPTAEKTVMLRTQQDAKSMYAVHIIAREGTEFSPLAGDSPTKTFQAKAFLGDSDVTSMVDSFSWFVSENGVETPIGDLLGFVSLTDAGSGTGTDLLTLDADFFVDLLVVLRVRAKAGDQSLQPCQDSVQLTRRTPKLVTNVYSPNGDSVRQSTSGTMLFKQQVRTAVGDIPEEIARKYLHVEWAKRNANGAYSAAGVGMELTLPADSLKTPDYSSTLVKADVYLKERYAVVTQAVPYYEARNVVQTVDGTECQVVQEVNGVEYQVVQDVLQYEDRIVTQDGKTVIEMT